MLSIVGDGVKFVEFILAQAFGTKTDHSKAKTGEHQQGDRGQNEGSASQNDAALREEFGPQSRGDDCFCFGSQYKNSLI
jgi:hypothetical protein